MKLRITGSLLLFLTPSTTAWAETACVPALFGSQKQPFCLEVANDFESRSTGLQNRRYLAPRGGMLFVFEDDSPRVFWMKDTYLELDILFLDQHKRIHSFVTQVPPGEIKLHAPAKYVIELPGKTAESLDLWPGDQVTFSDDLLRKP